MEIKVRAWDKKLNVMWEPITLKRLLSYLVFQNCPNAVAYEAMKDHFADMVWLQSTGLRDKKGVDAYRGDIAEDEARQLWIVRWADDAGGFELILNGADPEAPEDGEVEYMSEIGFMNIRGTIHSNPELMETP